MWETAGLLFLLIGFFLWIFYISRTHKFGGSFIPSELEVVERIIALTEVEKGDVFYELGSGDGRIVIAAALRGAKTYGVEIDRFRVWYSRLWIRLLKLGQNAQILHQDFFKVNLSKADVICLFLLPKTNEKLTKKFKKELKKGARVISYGFPLVGWKPHHVDPHAGFFGHLYLYKKQ